MKVIASSFEILDGLDRESLAVRIEACGRLCYKSEDKISAESAVPFIRTILKHGHNSVTEMGVLTLRVLFDSEVLASQLYQVMPRFLHIDRIDKDEMLITGSVRSFRELYMNNPGVKIIKAISAYLSRENPLFFEDMQPRHGWVPQDGVSVAKVALAEVDSFSPDRLAKHRYIAVKFTVNRAVTHEIVRHRPCSYLQESQRYCRYSQDKFGNEVTFIKPIFFEKGSSEYQQWEKAMVDTEKIYLKLLETSSPQAARTVLPNSCKTELITYANLLEWLHIFRLRVTPPAEPSMREIMIPLYRKFQEIFPTVFGDLELNTD